MLVWVVLCLICGGLCVCVLFDFGALSDLLPDLGMNIVDFHLICDFRLCFGVCVRVGFVL